MYITKCTQIFLIQPAAIFIFFIVFSIIDKRIFFPLSFNIYFLEKALQHYCTALFGK